MMIFPSSTMKNKSYNISIISGGIISELPLKHLTFTIEHSQKKESD